VPRVITGFRRGNAPAMADPACIASRGTGFRHSGIRATPAAAHTGVFPSHRWFQRQLNTRLSRERQGETGREGTGGEGEGGAFAVRFARSLARSLVARDALPRRYYRVSLPSRAMAGLGRTRARQENRRGKGTRESAGPRRTLHRVGALPPRLPPSSPAPPPDVDSENS